VPFIAGGVKKQKPDGIMEFWNDVEAHGTPPSFFGLTRLDQP